MSPRARKPASGAASPSLRDGLIGAGRGALAIALSPMMGQLLLGGLVVAGFGAASWRVKARVVERPCYSIDRNDLVRAPLPEFLTDRARDDLAAIEFPPVVNAFEPGLVGQLGLQLRKLPWVESVESVSVDWDGTRDDAKLQPRVRYALKIARPIARIRERAGNEVLVARSGRRIPADRVAGLALPAIEGLPDESSLERPVALEEALALVAAFQRRGLAQRLDLDAIALVRAKSGREVQLVLAHGPRVDFGPLGDALGAKVEERLDRLEGFLAKGPALAQLEKLSVRWDDPVYVLKPVATEVVTRQ